MAGETTMRVWCNRRRQPIISLAMAVACAGLFADRALSGEAVTVNVFPNVETFVTHHTYITVYDCKLVGPGSYTVLTKPQHGEVSTKPVLYTDKPPQPCVGVTFPFATVYYTWTDTHTTDRQDVFEVKWIPPPCSPPDSCDVQPVSVVVTIEEGPRIIFQGKDITNTTQTVSLGQQIALTTTPIEAGQTQSWIGDLDKKQTVGGYTASGNYSRTHAKGTGAVQDADFTQSSTTFYWTMVGTKNVTYTVHSGGQTGTAQATFKVQGPTCAGSCVKVQLGEVDIYQFENVWWMGFGNIDTAKRPGITFTEVPDVPQSGDFVWVQTYSEESKEYSAHGAVENCTSTPNGAALDTTFPYAVSIGPYALPGTTNDSPDNPLQSDWSKLSVTENFKMYLMWQPTTYRSSEWLPLPGSIPVPLGYVAWTWSGTAVNDPTVIRVPWSLKTSDRSALFHAGNDFPLWTYVAGTGAEEKCH